MGDYQNAMNRILSLIFAVQLCCLSYVCLSKAYADDISKGDLDKIATISQSLEADQAALDYILQAQGFPPDNAPSTWNEWERWPAIRKLELVYTSAEAAKAGNGEALINSIARQIAASHVAAIRDEPSLQGVFMEPQGTKIVEPQKKFLFSATFSAPADGVPPAIRAKIATISRYAQGTPREFLFGRCCQLTDAETYEILRHSDSDKAAIEEALTKKAPPPSVEKKFADFVDAIREQNAAVNFEPALAQTDLLQTHEMQLSDKADATTTASLGDASSIGLEHKEPSFSPPPFNGSGGGGELMKSPAAKAYRTFESTMYPGAGGGARSFSRMIGRVVGFGGVIFGNELKAVDGIGKTSSLSWVPGPTKVSVTAPQKREAWGRFAFKQEGGTILLSHLLRADTAEAALLIASEVPSGNVLGHGFGIVGFTGQFRALELTENGPSSAGTGFSYLVHPGAIQTEFGRSMMMVDTMPQIDDDFIGYLEAKKIPGNFVQQMKQVLDQDLGQYKFVDVPLEIYSDTNGSITVRRVAKAGDNLSDDLRSTAFITLLPFHDSDPQPENSTPFYSLVPTLITASDPFARANEFAEAFALVRWAKVSGAKWAGDGVPFSPLPPSSALIVDDNKQIEFVSSRSDYFKRLVRSGENIADQLALQSGNQRLKVKTQEYRTALLKLVSSSTELSELQPLRMAIASAFLNNEELASQYPEMAQRFANPFEQDLFGEAEEEDDRNWVAKHLDETEKVAPGTKRRLELAREISQQQRTLQNELEDGVGFFNVLTENRYKTELSKLLTQQDQADSNDNEAADDPVVSFVDGKVPGLGKWMDIQDALIHAVNM
ncbi:MAG TPA: hypothetical protein VN229_21310 [Terriglobales bacterium]|nr:hypothetical protein [Terriglobales bacterium]